jgi:uncharacterized membrane protein
MKKISTLTIVLNGLMIAFVFLATYIIRIPTATGGYVNIGDAAIIIAALLLGKNAGLIAGAIGSCFADLAAGYALYAPATFVIKGIEGYIVGLIAWKAINAYKLNKNEDTIRLFASVVGAVIMVAGYFIAEAFVLSLIDKSLGLTAAFTEILPNTVQGVVSVVIGYLVSTVLLKNGLQNRISNQRT